MRKLLGPLALALVGCSDDFLTPPASEEAVTMEASSSEGLAIVPQSSGGGAAPQAIEVALVKKTRDKTGRFGARRSRSPSIVAGSGYGSSGGSGLGMGGLGTGGSGMGLLAEFDRARTQTRERTEFDVSAFAWAEVALPYQEGPAGKFNGRPDTTINETTLTNVDYFSTFGIDVDTAAYTIARSSLDAGNLPTPTLVRPEEFLNYFEYDYMPPVVDDQLFSIEADGARSPLESERYFLRVGIQAQTLGLEERRPLNLVFLVDTSCSMTGAERLPMAKKCIEKAVESLKPTDQVAITTYAGGVSLALPPTPADQRSTIRAALAALASGGSTAMQSGLQLAYEQAEAMLRPGTLTRVVVLSDGDANVGKTTPEELLADIHAHQERGITLSTIGFGNGNYRDDMMETLANKGNGNYFYIDSERQADRVFKKDLFRMVVDIAQDVKIQVELDGDAVESYRLVGYENRAIKDEDFRNDVVDAGEIGSGHQVTALYDLKLRDGADGPLATIRVRAKQPGGKVAKEVALRVPVGLIKRPFASAPPDFRFATAVVGAAELLRQSNYAHEWSWDQVISVASGAAKGDVDRMEFLGLARRAQSLTKLAAR